MSDSPSRLPLDEGLVLSGLIDFLVRETPSLESLSRNELKQVAKAMVFDDLKSALRGRVEIEKIDYLAKRELFLARAAKKSMATLKAYTAAIEILESWASRAGVIVLEMKGRDADSFIDSLEGSPSTIRLRVAACSSFFTFLERETDGRIRNPFRGTKARPKRQSEAPEVPSLEEVEVIRASVLPHIQAAITVILEHGFRVGALPTLTIRAGRYSGMSKGKEITGTISITSLSCIKAAGLDGKKPFSEYTEEKLRNAFRRATTRLYNEGKIRVRYSIHDLRHHFAIREYRKDKDIYRLKSLLGYASIQVTENYLKGIEAN